MTNIIVQWTAQNEVVPNATSINHFGIKLTGVDGTIIDDASEPLTSSSHTFVNVAAGDYFIVAQSYNADESQSSAPPMQVPVTVPPEATAPVIVNLTTNLVTQ